MKQVTMYRSEAGGVFNTPIEALRDDLAVILSKLAENEPIGQRIAGAITSDNDTFDALEKLFKQLGPLMPARSAPPRLTVIGE